MKSFLIALTLFMAFSLDVEGMPRPPKKPTRPSWATGCHNEVLKKGYDHYMSPRTLAGMIAITRLSLDGRRFWDPIYTREVQEEVANMIVIPDPDGPTSYSLATFIYPLREKGFITNPFGHQGPGLDNQPEWIGKYSVKMQMQTFWEIYNRSCELRNKKPVGLKQLDIHPDNALPPPPLELSDYLILSKFFRGAHLGSTEIYTEIRDQLSYYKIFFPKNTAGAVLPRLRSYVRAGWLQPEGIDYQSRVEGGSVFKFSITDEGRAAVRHTEAYFLRLMGFFITTISREEFKNIFN